MPIKIINERHKGVQPEQQDFVVKFAKQCIRELNKKKYGLPELTTVPLIVWTKPRIRSCGGIYPNSPHGIIKISLHYLNDREVFMDEYAAIEECHVLGSFIASPELVLKGVIAHEIAHFVQRVHCKDNPKMQKSHGEGWRRLYSWLRRELINPHTQVIGASKSRAHREKA